MKLRDLIFPVAALLVAGLTSMFIVLLAGESPWVLYDAFKNTLGTSFGLGYTLFYTTPLIFTGLSVAVAFHCGLFNIGAEGQLYIGSLAVVAAAYFFPNLPGYLTLPMAVLAAMLAAGAFGSLAGAMKAYRGSHEVIVTILLNFIAVSFVDYFILNTFRNPESQNPESFVLPTQWHLPPLSSWFANLGWFENTPLNASLFLALAAAFIVYFVLFHTVWGFELRTVGQNPTAAKYAGISVNRNMVLAFFIAGALAGLVGVNEVAGNQNRLIQGFSPQYGFTGIAVAMLAKNNPIGIIISAFLFGAFHNSARELEFASEKISKELSFVIQGTLIAIVAAEHLWRKILTSRKKGAAHA